MRIRLELLQLQLQLQAYLLPAQDRLLPERHWPESLAPLSAFSFGARRARLCSGGLETRRRPLHQPFRIGDGTTVLTLANLAGRIEGFDLELVEFAFHAEERGFRGNSGVVERGRQMLDVDRHSDRKLAGLEQRPHSAGASRLHQGDHARRRKDLRKNFLRGNAKCTGQAVRMKLDDVSHC